MQHELPSNLMGHFVANFLLLGTRIIKIHSMKAPCLGQLDGEFDQGSLPGRACLFVDVMAFEDGGLAAASLFTQRGFETGRVVHGSISALVLQ